MLDRRSCRQRVLEFFTEREGRTGLTVAIRILLPDGADAAIHRELGEGRFDELVADACRWRDKIIDELEGVAQVVDLSERAHTFGDGVLVAKRERQPVRDQRLFI